MPEYVPHSRVEPVNRVHVKSAWKGLEVIIPDILDRFEVGRGSCIEFGVEFGYSTAVFSNYFDRVVGVDSFEGDFNTADRVDHFQETSERLSCFKNIELHKMRYQQWITRDDGLYDFAHVDIVHTYRDTFQCGVWAARHSKCVVFHDTESFVDVRNAVLDVAEETGKQVFNYPFSYGLGILVPR